MGSIPGSGRSRGGGHGISVQYSCRETAMDRGAWRGYIHRVAGSDTTETTEHTCMLALQSHEVNTVRPKGSRFHNSERPNNLSEVTQLAWNWSLSPELAPLTTVPLTSHFVSFLKYHRGLCSKLLGRGCVVNPSSALRELSPVTFLSEMLSKSLFYRLGEEKSARCLVEFIWGPVGCKRERGTCLIH